MLFRSTIMNKEIMIGNHKISEDSPTFVIAEMSANHLMDFDRAVAIMQAAKDAGADAIKILGRKFINHPSEKDRMYRTLGRIRRFEREHSSAQSRGRWAYTKRLNIELGRKIAGAIVKNAEENHADVIVFEYLEMQGKISGKKKQKLHLWRKRDIQKRCEHQAQSISWLIPHTRLRNCSRKTPYPTSGRINTPWQRAFMN